MIKNSNSTFVITKEYQGNEEVPSPTPRNVSIILKINYHNKIFDIENSNGNKQFMFYTTSYKWREWLAVLECIKEAIEFANKELGITDKKEDETVSSTQM